MQLPVIGSGVEQALLQLGLGDVGEFGVETAHRMRLIQRDGDIESLQPLFLASSQMVANYGLGPIFDGMGLIHAVLSYCGGITITFTSCPGMLPDPASYERCIRKAFDELAKAAGVRDEAAVASAAGL